MELQSFQKGSKFLIKCKFSREPGNGESRIAYRQKPLALPILWISNSFLYDKYQLRYKQKRKTKFFLKHPVYKILAKSPIKPATWEHPSAPIISSSWGMMPQGKTEIIIPPLLCLNRRLSLSFLKVLVYLNFPIRDHCVVIIACLCLSLKGQFTQILLCKKNLYQ